MLRKMSVHAKRMSVHANNLTVHAKHLTKDIRNFANMHCNHPFCPVYGTRIYHITRSA